jgi:hypothetical protein
MDLIHFIDTNFKMLPTSVTSLLAALGLVLVFVTGVVLDLFGSRLLQNVERKVFIDLARQHAEWFRPLAERSRPYIGRDFEVVQEVRVWLSNELFFHSWRWKKIRREYVALQNNAGNPREAYVRLNSFIIGYVTLKAGSVLRTCLRFSRAQRRHDQASLVRWRRPVPVCQVTGFTLHLFRLDPKVLIRSPL